MPVHQMAAFMLCAHVALPYLQGGKILVFDSLLHILVALRSTDDFLFPDRKSSSPLQKKSLLLVISNNAGQVVLAYFAN